MRERIDLYVRGPIAATPEGRYTFETRGSLKEEPRQTLFDMPSPTRGANMTTQAAKDIALILYFFHLRVSGFRPIQETVRTMELEARRVARRRTLLDEDDKEDIDG